MPIIGFFMHFATFTSILFSLLPIIILVSAFLKDPFYINIIFIFFFLKRLNFSVFFFMESL